MSTQTSFDVHGLGQAIHLCDAEYELALYADGAEMSVSDLDDPDRAALVFVGKAGIADWIRGRASSAGTHRVVHAEVKHSQLTFVEECEFVDGESDIYIYRAEISRGQIQRCAVTKRHLSVDEAPFTAAAPSAHDQLMVDDGPPTSPPSPHRPTSSERVGNRALAGNFLG